MIGIDNIDDKDDKRVVQEGEDHYVQPSRLKIPFHLFPLSIPPSDSWTNPHAIEANEIRGDNISPRSSVSQYQVNQINE